MDESIISFVSLIAVVALAHVVLIGLPAFFLIVLLRSVEEVPDDEGDDTDAAAGHATT